MRSSSAIPVVPLLVALALTGCNPKTAQQEAPVTENAAGGGAPQDPHSFANPQEAAVRHLALDVRVDFADKRIVGRASLFLERGEGSSQLVLDTKDLDVQGVFLAAGESDQQEPRPARFALGEARFDLGQPLTVELEPGTTVVHVDYASSPGAGALQWLEPAQTAGGKQPFLFSQNQAILARTWIPCQDTPQVRMTYEATVRVPPELMAVMSAENPTAKAADGVYHFEMQQPVPVYLLALAVGDLEFRSLSERTGVYAEPSVVERAAWEFAETERMIELAESLYGPYLWGRYDVLVLPPSFPFGGMENPRLTFATPTILAGDRSLTALVAHELAHSWSGNLVTNATWNDLWLNEGFTVYFERRIMEALKGRDYAEMLALLGYQDLERQVERLGADNPDTHLRLRLGPQREPDDAFSDVPYEKGYFFLRALEEACGRVAFDAFLAEYFRTFAFQSLDTDGFLEYLRATLLREHPEIEREVHVAAWIDGPGIPPGCPQVTSPAFAQVNDQIAAWQAGTPAARLDTEDWETHRQLHFVRHLPETMTAEQMADLDAAFGFTGTGNAEILNAWLHHVIANHWEPALPRLETFLTGMGRRKFLDPLYRQLASTEEGKQLARAIYAKARPTYHPLAVATIDEVLGWDESRQQ